MFSGGLPKVLGVGLCHDGDQQYRLSYIVLERKGNELQVIAKKSLAGNLSKVLEALPRSLPLAMAFSGKGVIHKNISITAEGADSDKLFREAFPSIAAQDFFIQSYLGETQGCLSIVRREMVQELLDKFKHAGLDIYQFSLGGLAVLNVLPQLNSYGEQLQFDGHQFTLSNKQFAAYKYQEGIVSSYPIKVGEEQLAEDLLLAYSAAFQLLLHDKVAPILAEVEQVNQRFDQFSKNSRWKKIGMFFLFGLFALLLISFVLFSHYNQLNEKLLREVGAQTASADQMELLGQNIAKQEKLLKQLTWNGGYNYGFLVHEIGSTMPRPLTLLSLAMNDFKTEQEKLERLPNIRIKGSTANLTAVNNWIFVLREKTWVKSAKLLKFQEEQDSERYQFEIIMTY